MGDAGSVGLDLVERAAAGGGGDFALPAALLGAVGGGAATPLLGLDDGLGIGVSMITALAGGLALCRLAAGVYSFMPPAWRALRKIEQIVREEMEAAGAQEIRMPAMQPLELWQETGRDRSYGPVLFRLRDRRERPMVLAPTHEEAVTDLFRKTAQSYRDLPQRVFQMQTKFRDEPRPRGGLIRVAAQWGNLWAGCAWGKPRKLETYIIRDQRSSARSRGDPLALFWRLWDAEGLGRIWLNVRRRVGCCSA